MEIIIAAARASMSMSGVRGLEGLNLTVGPMFSGKSSACLATYRRLLCWHKFDTIIVVKSSKDTRWGGEGIITHNVDQIECMRTERVSDILSHVRYGQSKFILIDEAQMFYDLEVGVKKMLRDNKCVFVYALDGDRNQTPFSAVCNLLPMATTVEKLLSVCSDCGANDAAFTVSNRGDLGEVQLVLGGEETYRAVCCQCLTRLRQKHPLSAS